MMCPLCKTDEPKLRRNRAHGDDFATIEGQCKTCGNLSISEECLDHIPAAEEYKLSAFFRRFGSAEQPPLVTSENVRDCIRLLPVLTPTERFDDLLNHLAQKTPLLGGPALFDFAHDYPLIMAHDAQEADLMVKALVARGFLRHHGGPCLTVSGWERLDQLSRASRTSSRVFVAMWFDPGRDSIYDAAIEPAVKEAGYLPLRIDRKHHANRIDDEIMAGLRGSKFMIADFTGQRGGVYFESGFMQGLGRTVIWICDEADRKELHFDIEHFLFIFYKDAVDLKKKLMTKILAIEGRGTLLDPTAVV
jgi:hypothetical protein